MKGLLEGTAPGATPMERAIVSLARRSCHEARSLSPADLSPLRALAGDGALELALVVAQFHFINRMADLLGVSSELPASVRRFATLRSLGMRLFAWAVARMDLKPRAFDADPGATLERATRWVAELPALGARPDVARLRPTPHVAEAIAIGAEELLTRGSLSRGRLERVFALVEDALPLTEADVSGLHPRPDDPVDAFAFVWTRYAQRTTPRMIDALRGASLDDPGILDLAVAVAFGNGWARLFRLLGAS